MRVLLSLWFVILPPLLYALWMLWRRRKARKGGHALPAFTEGPVAMTITATLLLVIAGFIGWDVSNPASDGRYVPPHSEGGVIVPGHVAP